MSILTPVLILIWFFVIQGSLAFHPVMIPCKTSPLRMASQHRSVSQDLLNRFNAQVTKELEASQLYLSASIWCDHHDFDGMANYMRSESEDERGHALSFIDFALKRKFPLQLESIGAPMGNWKTPEDLWESLLLAEESNTESLLSLADAAAACNNHAVAAFLQPHHMEQVNAEDKLSTILAKVRDENQTPGLLRQLDAELGTKQSRMRLGCHLEPSIGGQQGDSYFLAGK
jgi:ferritin